MGKIAIEHFDGIVGTPALTIAVRGWADILEAGFASPHMWPLAHDNEAFVAVDDMAGPVGVLTFSHQKWSKEIVVTLGYVRQAHRRRGIYDQLWKALVKHARKIKVSRISGGLAVSNSAMRATAKAQGRLDETIGIVFYLAPKKKGR